MTDAATAFYQINYSEETTNEERWEATQAFLSNPENLPSCFSFLVNPQNPITAKKFIALTMRRIFFHFWEGMKENEELVQGFKQMAFDAIKSTADSSLADIIIYSIETIIINEVGSWPEYFELISQHFESQQPNLILISMEMINNAVNYMAFSEYEQNYEFLHGVILSQLQSGDADRIVAAARLLNRCVHVPGTNLEVFVDLIQALTEFFVGCLPDFQAIFPKVSASLSEVVKVDELPIDPTELFSVFSGIFSNEALTPPLYYAALSPICNLINKNPEAFVEQVPELFKFIFDCSVQVLQGNQEYFDQNPASYLTYNIKLIADVPDYQMFDEMKSIFDSVEEQTEETIIASCLMYNEVIEILVEDAATYNPTIIQACIEYLGVESELVQEAAMNVLISCANKLQSTQVDLADLIIQNVIPFACPDAITFIDATLSVIENTLESASISSSLIQPLAQALFALVQASPETAQKVISILSDLITTTNGDATPIITDFFEIAQAFTQTEDPNEFIAKGVAIEFFANVVANQHDGIEEEQIGQILQLVVETSLASVEIEDKALQLSIIMALQTLIKARIPVLMEIKDKIPEIVDFLFDSCNIFSLADDSEDMNFSTDDMNIMTNLFILLQTIFSTYNELLPESLDKWFNYAISFGSIPFDDMALEALISCKYMLAHVYRNEIDPTPFIEHLFGLFDTANPVIVAENLVVISDLVSEDIALPEELVQKAIENANLLLAGGHRVQKEDDLCDCNIEEVWNNGCYKKLFEFYDTLYDKGIDAIEPLKFIEAFSEFEKMKEDDSKEPVAYYINSLVKLYVKGKTIPESIPVIGLGRIIEIVKSNIEICDFTVTPTPLEGARTILLNDPSAFEGDSSVIEGIGEILSAEYSGELHFWDTTMSAISFICTCVAGGFDPSEFIEAILNKLPIKGDLRNSEVIYSTLLSIITAENGEIYTKLLQIVVTTLGFHDKVFASMELSAETFEKMKASVLAVPDTEAFIGEVFGEDQISLQRCVARLQ